VILISSFDSKIPISLQSIRISMTNNLLTFFLSFDDQSGEFPLRRIVFMAPQSLTWKNYAIWRLPYEETVNEM